MNKKLYLVIVLVFLLIFLIVGGAYLVKKSASTESLSPPSLQLDKDELTSNVGVQYQGLIFNKPENETKPSTIVFSEEDTAVWEEKSAEWEDAGLLANPLEVGAGVNYFYSEQELSFKEILDPNSGKPILSAEKNTQLIVAAYLPLSSAVRENYDDDYRNIISARKASNLSYAGLYDNFDSAYFIYPRGRFAAFTDLVRDEGTNKYEFIKPSTQVIGLSDSDIPDLPGDLVGGYGDAKNVKIPPYTPFVVISSAPYTAYNLKSTSQEPTAESFSLSSQNKGWKGLILSNASFRDFANDELIGDIGSGNSNVWIQNDANGFMQLGVEDLAGFSLDDYYFVWVFVDPDLLIVVEETEPEICNNGVDDDGDGFADCVDFDCENQLCSAGNYSGYCYKPGGVCLSLSSNCVNGDVPDFENCLMGVGEPDCESGKAIDADGVNILDFRKSDGEETLACVNASGSALLGFAGLECASECEVGELCFFGTCMPVDDGCIVGTFADMDLTASVPAVQGIGQQSASGIGTQPSSYSDQLTTLAPGPHCLTGPNADVVIKNLLLTMKDKYCEGAYYNGNSPCIEADPCGNGVIDEGEICDASVAGHELTSLCDNNCTIVDEESVALQCRAMLNDIDSDLF
ncbi:hypothetical protein KJ632_00260, partial [Patescibacteria group bacterium]|nr:hypothetical protein [Patescibacteria group bacterium]